MFLLGIVTQKIDRTCNNVWSITLVFHMRRCVQTSCELSVWNEKSKMMCEKIISTLQRHMR